MTHTRDTVQRMACPYVIVPWKSRFDGRKKGERLAFVVRTHNDSLTVHEWIASAKRSRAKYTAFTMAETRPATKDDFKRFNHRVPPSCES